jgi:hypothetical protein
VFEKKQQKTRRSKHFTVSLLSGFFVSEIMRFGSQIYRIRSLLGCQSTLPPTSSSMDKLGINSPIPTNLAGISNNTYQRRYLEEMLLNFLLFISLL